MVIDQETSDFSTLITCAIVLIRFGNTFGASIVKGFSLPLQWCSC